MPEIFEKNVESLKELTTNSASGVVTLISVIFSGRDEQLRLIIKNNGSRFLIWFEF